VRALADIPTPALLIDADVLESNISKLATHARDRGLGVRPHAKTHRCPEIARRQVAAGALGVACAKLGEAEVMASAGIPGLLITTEIVAPEAVNRLMSLLGRAPDTTVVIDNVENARQLSEVASSSGGLTVGVLLDLDVGARRTGVQPGGPALQLALQISQLPHLRLRGLQAYAAQASHQTGWNERRQSSQAALSLVSETASLLQEAGLEMSVVAGSSTGTYDIDSELDCLTELQCGSYSVMDTEYRLIGGRESEEFCDFGMALSVMATVISVRSEELVIVDAGTKAFATDCPMVPVAVDRPELTYSWAGDEHGRLAVAESTAAPALGERLRFYPPHCDPTMNLYDRVYVVRNGHPEDIWSISARGRSD
jgi:D-serine deaminase-like pyridoxal phosphate-dependent protein